MSQSNPMKLVILEDDLYEVNRFINSVEKRDDIELVGTTNSCDEAINYIKENNVEGIIVDLELNTGVGDSGLKFLTDLNNLPLDIKPIIIVTTKTSSDIVQCTARDLGADLVFWKSKPDYNPEMVLNTFITLRKTLSNRIPKSEINKTNLETAEQRKNRITKKINAELDLIGIGHHLKGRKYIADAIYFLIENENSDTSYMTYLIKKHNKVNGTISNAMQTAINNAWSRTPIQDLEKHFTARISYKNGSPTPTEFICYYVDKVKKFIN